MMNNGKQKNRFIREILEIHKRERWIAGHVYRRYPVRRGIGYVGIKNVDNPIVYDLVEHTTQINTLTTTRTKRNLYSLKMQYDIDWFYIMKYRTESESPATRYAFIIYGLVNGNLVTFFRKETYSTVAGQTWLYFGNGNRIQVCNLKNLKSYVNHYVNKAEIPQFIHHLKRMNKIMNHVILEKLILLYS